MEHFISVPTGCERGAMNLNLFVAIYVLHIESGKLALPTGHSNRAKWESIFEPKLVTKQIR
jgi:hypothetical protein